MTRPKPSLLLVTPPLTQLNTPYPATQFLKGFLNQFDYTVHQADLGIEFITSIFTRSFLNKVFDNASQKKKLSQQATEILQQKEQYLFTIESVIRFLQNQDPTLSSRIVADDFLPKGQRFAQMPDLEWAYGDMGINDKAKYFATLYLEDLGDFIQQTLSANFGFSRYAEHIALVASHFDPIEEELQKETGLLDELLIGLFDTHLQQHQPDVVGFTVPFPGNLYGALRCAQHLRKKYPTIPILMGGGYVNTELRSISDTRLFKYVDYLTLDDGEAPLVCLLEYLQGLRTESELCRTFIYKNNQIEYINNPEAPKFEHSQIGTPDYEGIPLQRYLSFVDMVNPMHRLWNDGRWNKLMIAHGCYWGRCTFCDISLDYIRRFSPASAALLADRMEAIIAQTGQTGFHFVDEAAPPKLLKELSNELLRRQTIASWWGNIRFESHFDYATCQQMAKAGCIAVTGGLEVASPRILRMINKGVSLEQVVQVTCNFTEAGILVHAYLMYGYASQTEQETIDSLEMVRQLFANNLLQSGFWHRLAVTAHSPIGKSPSSYGVEIADRTKAPFANNELAYHDPTGIDHDAFGPGLAKALYNYMHGIGIDYPLDYWFEFDIPHTTMNPRFVKKTMQKYLKTL